MNNRRVVRFIQVTDGDIVDLPRTAVPGVGRRGSSSAGAGFIGRAAIGAPEIGSSFSRHGRTIALGATVDGDHILLGFMPAPLNPRARKPYEPSGWLIVLVDEAVKAQPARLRRNAKAVA